MPVGGSPELFATSYVLLSLLAPRDPPYALHYLTKTQLLSISLNVKVLFPNLFGKLKALRSLIQKYTDEIVQASILLVEVTGIEPATSCVQGRRSPN